MSRSTDFWDNEISHPTHVSWMADPQVRAYINRLVAGSPDDWPLEWFQRATSRRFERGLSIGCGGGALERDLIRRDICESVDAFDGSIASLSIAQRESISAGYEYRIRYFAADFNRPALPTQAYDIVFFHQSLHHVANLEDLLAQVLDSLRPDGILYIDEYIGPSRHDWDDRLIALHRIVWAMIPQEQKLFGTLGLPIQPDDESEAIRSSEIMDLVSVGFDVVQQRDYGGNLLAVLFPGIDWSRASMDLLASMIAAERVLLGSGANSYHTVLVAHPSRGFRRTAARIRYRFRSLRSRGPFGQR